PADGDAQGHQQQHRQVSDGPALVKPRVEAGQLGDDPAVQAAAAAEHQAQDPQVGQVAVDGELGVAGLDLFGEHGCQVLGGALAGAVLDDLVDVDPPEQLPAELGAGGVELLR